jgi:hypothetical protein
MHLWFCAAHNALHSSAENDPIAEALRALYRANLAQFLSGLFRIHRLERSRYFSLFLPKCSLERVRLLAGLSLFHLVDLATAQGEHGLESVLGDPHLMHFPVVLHDSRVPGHCFMDMAGDAP